MQYWVFFGLGLTGVVTFEDGVVFGLLGHRVGVSGRKREARARDGVRAAERGEDFLSAAVHRGRRQGAVGAPDGRGLYFFQPRTPHRAMPTNSNCTSSSKAAAATAAAASPYEKVVLAAAELGDGQRQLVGVKAAAADAQSLGIFCGDLRQRVNAARPAA